MRRTLAAALAFSCVLVACGGAGSNGPGTGSGASSLNGSGSAMSNGGSMGDGSTGGSIGGATGGDTTGTNFGSEVAYTATTATFDSAITKDFSTTEAENLAAIEKAYGIKLSDAEKAYFEKNKFLLKNLPDTSITPKYDGESSREVAGLYETVAGSNDYKERTPANAVFYPTDVFLHHYNLLYTELLKEMEITTFFPQMQALSKTLFTDASTKLAAATTDKDKRTWTEVRNYAAVPYVIFATAPAIIPVQSDSPDAPAPAADDSDTYDTAAAFVATLKLDAASEKAVLADLKNVYTAGSKEVPAVLAQSMKEFADDTNVEFTVDFSQFTPRGEYTGSAQRRQYFRGMSWFIQVPFFLKSPQLTQDAFALSSILPAHADQFAAYGKMDLAIDFLVGTSDDLTPMDYLDALKTGDESAMMTYLMKLHNPKIKSLSASYGITAPSQTDDVIALSKGLRLFSGKFIIDSSWTQYLTQGDEAPRPGYTQKLPPMASSLEVMSLLGSSAATDKIPTLDFYKPETREAIDHAMADLKADDAKLTDADWQKNVYMTSLWTLQGMFGWLDSHTAQLPVFMQNPLWQVKTLQAASGFWTEMRHATILYAKQSGAELGGGPGACDDRKIPAPPAGYVEPNIALYDRLLFLANRTQVGLKDLGFTFQFNNDRLTAYISAVTDARAIALQELANQTWTEKQTSSTFDYEDENGVKKPCTEYSLADGSDFERVRKLASSIAQSQPYPVEAAVLSPKTRRAAIVVDVHTGQDSNNPAKILYEGSGVPQVLLVAVKDANGPRVAIGFTYSHYEFTEPYGGNRMTDEDWQKNFYQPTDDSYSAYQYTKPSTWPAQPSWYSALWAH